MSAFFQEESTLLVSRRYLEAPYMHTDKPKPMSPHFFQVGGINMNEKNRIFIWQLFKEII